MTIAYENSASSDNTAAGTTLTYSRTIAVVASGLAVEGVTNVSGTARTISSVVHNATDTYTALGTAHTWASDSVNWLAQYYYKKSPTAATGNMVITMSASASVIGSGNSLFSGVDQTTTFRTLYKNTPASGPTVTLTVSDAQAGDIVLGLINGYGDAGTFTTPAGTQAWEQEEAYNEGSVRNAQYVVSVSGGDTLSWTVQSGAGVPTLSNGCIGVAIIPASSGTTYQSDVSETGSAADTVAGAKVLGGTVTETGAAADTAGGGLVLTAAVAETGSAADTQGGAVATPGSMAESGSAADTIAGALALAGSESEAGAAVDTFGGTLVLTASISESGSVADTVDAAPQQSGDVAEAGSLADTFGGTLVLSASIAESGSAADTVDATPQQAGDIAESGTLADTVGGGLVLTADLAESGALLDVVAAGLVLTGSIVETGTLADTLGTDGPVIFGPGTVALADTEFRSITALDAGRGSITFSDVARGGTITFSDGPLD